MTLIGLTLSLIIVSFIRSFTSSRARNKTDLKSFFS